MDEDRIGLVLVKTSELRSKIISCIHKTERESGERESTEYVEEEADSLVNIKDALESLEAQLSSLQALQQQQWYEKEAALAEIECCQKKLLKELKEYKGKSFEVVNEAMSFASETEDKADLLLPPYPTRPSQQTLVSKNGYLSTFSASQKSPQNGGLKGLDNNIPSNLQESESEKRRSGLGGAFKSLKFLIGKAAKTGVVVVGVIAILSLAGFEPRVRKGDDQLKILDLFRKRRNGEEESRVGCPPGKVVIVENGVRRCVVKERVEVPFESVVAVPDVSYGWG